MEPLEERLRELEPRRLPQEWRGEILDTALGVDGHGAREVIVALFPRPLVIGLAAAWVLILGLMATMPGGGSELKEDREVRRAASGGLGIGSLSALEERLRVTVTGELEIENGKL